MLILGIALGVVIAVLLERISQQPKKPGKISVQQRAQVLAVTAVVLSVGLGITLASPPATRAGLPPTPPSPASPRPEAGGLSHALGPAAPVWSPASPSRPPGRLGCLF